MKNVMEVKTHKLFIFHVAVKKWRLFKDRVEWYWNDSKKNWEKIFPSSISEVELSVSIASDQLDPLKWQRAHNHTILALSSCAFRPCSIDTLLLSLSFILSLFRSFAHILSLLLSKSIHFHPSFQFSIHQHSIFDILICFWYLLMMKVISAWEESRERENASDDETSEKM